MKEKTFNEILFERFSAKVRRNTQFTLDKKSGFITATYADVNMKWVARNCHKAGTFHPTWKRKAFKALTTRVVNYYAKNPQLAISALRTKQKRHYY